MIYKFRAECLNDVVNFLFIEVGGIPLKQMTVDFDEDGKLPDVVVTIDTSATLEQIKDNLRGCGHSHVMAQTVAPIAEYTGKRTYN